MATDGDVYNDEPPTGYDWPPWKPRGKLRILRSGFLPILVDLTMKGYIMYIYTVICIFYVFSMYIHNSAYIIYNPYIYILLHSAQIPNRKGQIHPAAPSPGRLAAAGTLGALHELRNDGRKEDQDWATHQHLRTSLGEYVIQPWGRSLDRICLRCYEYFGDSVQYWDLEKI